MASAVFPNPTEPPFNLANVPFTDQDPVMDGLATSKSEWAKALCLPDTYFFGGTPRSGFYYFESKLNWVATSVTTGSQAKYDGTTVFVAHDIIGSSDPANPLHQFQVDESNNWNSFEFPTPAGNVRIWVFDPADDPDDSKWLPFAEGLDSSRLIPEGAAPNLIDDRGFIARLNDDPSTDVHWFPGMPEPGDPGWDWAAWHYVFGRYSFGQSFQTVGLDTDPKDAVNHEVYEFCCYRPNWTHTPRHPHKKRRRRGHPQPPSPNPWCIWWETINVGVPHSETVIVLVDGKPVKATLTGTLMTQVSVLRGQFWLHFWDPVLFQPGDPSPDQQAQYIVSELSAVLEEGSEEAWPALSEAIHDFREAYSALSASRYVEALRSFDRMSAAIRKAKSLGVDPLDLIDLEMQVLSLVSTDASKAVMDLDRHSTFEDENVRNAYRALYDFGQIVSAGRKEGLEFEAVKATSGLSALYDAVTKGRQSLPRRRELR